ncbi:hypothetical protein OSB04_005944 [Centaurea solstitialis]|uniref:Disease resistance R13L4/SHOC-2-like LRR domain-containing protein n=1 Tax=Centaurea solstitialis TaxID=347529 RepID=A0AA38TIR1_9ASTR|nr:hypothetical protein OSB04_005944 [Centaurea solstitialis]
MHFNGVRDLITSNAIYILNVFSFPGTMVRTWPPRPFHEALNPSSQPPPPHTSQQPNPSRPSSHPPSQPSSRPSAQPPSIPPTQPSSSRPSTKQPSKPRSQPSIKTKPQPEKPITYEDLSSDFQAELDETFPRSKYLLDTPNNHYLDFATIVTHHPIILEILKHHPLTPLLTRHTELPEVYLQQFYHSMKFVEGRTTSQESITCSIDEEALEITPDLFASILQILGGDMHEDHFTDAEQLNHFIALGYTKPLTRLSDIKRRDLPGEWSTLFGILNKCLSSRTRGVDKSNAESRQIFIGCALDDPTTDYKFFLWKDFSSIIKDKDIRSRARNFLPYPRFLGLLFEHFLKDAECPSSMSNMPKRIATPMTRLLDVASESQHVAPTVITPSLLTRADQSSPIVIRYLELLPLPVPPEPEAGTQEVPLRRESEGIERGHSPGGDDQGLEAEVSGEHDGGSLDGDSDRSRDATTHIDRSTLLTMLGLESDDSDDSNDDHHVDGAGGIRIEGDTLVEESELSVGRKRIDERVTGSEVLTDPSLPLGRSRAPTSATRTHSFDAGIEADTSHPEVQLHAPLSHSLTSQQVRVSFHGDIAQRLSRPHLEGSDIETGGSLPRSPTFLDAHVSLEPIDTHLGTYTASLSDAVSAPPLTILSDVTGTPRVASMTGVSRGPAGRPTTAIITPTVSVGHTVDSAVVQTGTLCEPGVTYLTSVVREMIESALKAQIDYVRAQFSGKIAALEAQVKGKSTARATTPPPPSSPPRSTTPAPSTDELRDLLMASLLSRGDLNDKEVHLLGSLKQFSDPSIPAIRPEPATAPSHAVGLSTQWLEGKFSDLREEVKSDIGKVKSSLLAIRRALSTSCRAAAEPTKRGHDDREDPGHREGENPKRARRITLALLGKSSGAASVRTSGTHTDTGADDRRRSKPDQSTVAVVEMVRQTSPSLSFGTPPPYMSPLPLTPSPTCHASSRPPPRTPSPVPSVSPPRASPTVPDFSAFGTPSPPPRSTVRSRAPINPVTHGPQRPIHGQWRQPSVSLPKVIYHNEKGALSNRVCMWNHGYQFDGIEKGDAVFILPVEKYLGITKLSKSDQVKHIHWMNTQAKPQGDVFFYNNLIVLLREVSSVRFHGLWFSVYTVIRRSTGTYTFTEADFDNVHIDDIESLYTDLKTLTKRPRAFFKGLEAVKRFIERNRRNSEISNFQIGLESHQKTINLTPPNQDLPNIDRYSPFDVLEKPSFGVVYLNEKGEKKFMWCDEVHKFSDGTLHYINLGLATEKKRLELEVQKTGHWINPSLLIDKVFRITEHRLEHRNVLRRLESFYGLRKIEGPARKREEIPPPPRRYEDLWRCLTGFLPEFQNHGLLEELNLNLTGFSGGIPKSIGNLNRLTVLRIDMCSFSEIIPSSLTNMTQLTFLELNFNEFTGVVPSLSSLTKLTCLNLCYNEFTDVVPSLTGLTKLTYLDLKVNNFFGRIPSSFMNLSQLEGIILKSSRLRHLQINHNSFTGRVELDWFVGLKKLKGLILGGNKISFVATNNYTYGSLPELRWVDLSSCNLKEYPGFLRFQQKLNRVGLE